MNRRAHGAMARHRRHVLQQASTPVLGVLEPLECRRLLTTTVLLDFGAALPAAGLTMTVQQFRNIAGTNTGPDFTQDSNTDGTADYANSDNVTFRPINTDFDGNGTTNAADLTALANAVLPVVQRAYAPFNVNVQLASASSAADVQASLNANGTSQGNHDAYDFIWTATSTAHTDNSVGNFSSLFGLAAGILDLNGAGVNANDECTITFADVVLGSVPAGGSLVNRIGYTAAHEASHTFALAHSDGVSGDPRLLTRGDQIRLGSDTRDSFNIFTRYSLARQNPPGGSYNNYDRLVADANIGAKAGYAYVTGTGANDKITITRTDATHANILVQAYRNAARAASDFVSSETYTIDTTGTIVVDASVNDDQIIYDANIGRSVLIRGGDDTDELIVNGTGTYTNVTYNATGAGKGDLNFNSGAFVVSFDELEPVTLNVGMNTLTVNVNDGGGANTITVGDDATAANGQSKITFDGGLENLTFNNPGTAFVLNSMGGDDNVTVNNLDSGFAASITIDAGAGNDTVDASAVTSLPVSIQGSSGEDTLTGGGGNDTINGSADDDSIFGNGGNDLIDGGANNDYIEGNAGSDTIDGSTGNDTARGGTGNDLVQGGAGNDTLHGNEDNDRLIGDSTVTGAAGNDEMHGDGGNDAMIGDNGTINAAGNSVAFADAGGGSDVMFGDTGNDFMFGQGGNDDMAGGADNDTMAGNTGNDFMVGDDGTIPPAPAPASAAPRTIGWSLGSAGTTVGVDSGGAGSVRISSTDAVALFARIVPIGAGATDGADLMTGDEDSDVMYGQGGNDAMSGADGSDYMEGNAGADVMSGGADDDDMIGGSSKAGESDATDNMTGGDGNDVMTGDNAQVVRPTDGAGSFLRHVAGAADPGLEDGAIVRNVTPLDLDTIGSADIMSGGNNDDLMFGQLGADQMTGDAGDDDMIGHLGADQMDGGTGDDGMIGDKGSIADSLLDGSGETVLTANDHKVNAAVYSAGTKFRLVTLSDAANGSADVMTGGTGDDFMHGGAGADQMSGNDGVDRMFGDAGNDTAAGGTGDDHMFGGAGDDDLDGNAGNDIVYGGDGQDRLVADNELDRLIDWFGNFNTFVVPGPGVGAKIIIRSPNPQVQQFLKDLAAGDGAADPQGEAQVVKPPSPGNSGPGLNVVDVEPIAYMVWDGGMMILNNLDTVVGTSGPDALNAMPGNVGAD